MTNGANIIRPSGRYYKWFMQQRKHLGWRKGANSYQCPYSTIYLSLEVFVPSLILWKHLSHLVLINWFQYQMRTKLQKVHWHFPPARKSVFILQSEDYLSLYYEDITMESGNKWQFHVEMYSCLATDIEAGLGKEYCHRNNPKIINSL